MSHIDNHTDSDIARILSQTKTIAIVGASANPDRPANRVGTFLHAKGFTVIPVNPGQAGKTLFGSTCVATLADIDVPVDMVDIFRRSDQVEGVVDDALRHLLGLKTIWMQLDIINEKAAALARAHGAQVVMDRCPKIEYARLDL